MQESEVVDMSEDNSKIRAKVSPEKWPLNSTSVMTFSNLKVDVPEFVPGQLYRLSSQATGKFMT